MLQRLLHNRHFDVDRFAALLRLPHVQQHVRTRLPWLHRDMALPAIFVLVSTLVTLGILNIASQAPDEWGVDARIYIRAAAAYRDGLDPWAASVAIGPLYDYHFAALPPTVLAFVPFTFVPEQVGVWLWLAISALAAIWIVRRLRLPLWWLAFPPLVIGVAVANPQIVLLAMLLSTSSVLKGLAPMLKIYALAPLVGERWLRGIVAALLMTAASYIAAPELWHLYFGETPKIASRLLEEAGGGYSASGLNEPMLLAVTLLGLCLLAVVDLRTAGWLAGPALVPASQFHLSTMVMPVLAANPSFVLSTLFAMEFRGLPSAVVAFYGTWRFYRAMRDRRLRGASPAAIERSSGPLVDELAGLAIPASRNVRS